MRQHLELLNGEVHKPTAAEKLAESLHEVVTNGSGELLPQVAKNVQELHDRIM